MSWAFHIDSGTISQERINFLDALHLQLNVTQEMSGSNFSLNCMSITIGF